MITFGAELEWADWDTHIPLPEQVGILNPYEVEVCNTNGRAWDWTKKRCWYGGEICVQPTKDITRLGEYVDYLRCLVGPTISHRCKTQIHIALDDLAQDVEAQKKVLQYTWDNHVYVREQVDKPKGNPDYVKAMNSMMVAIPRVASKTRLMTATTPEAFAKAHLPKIPTRDGGHRYAQAPRAYVNLRSLVKNGTVEFRPFWGTTDPEEVMECARWSWEFLDHALGDGLPVSEWYTQRHWRLPGSQSAQAEIEEYFQWTKRAVPHGEHKRRTFLPPE